RRLFGRGLPSPGAGTDLLPGAVRGAHQHRPGRRLRRRAGRARRGAMSRPTRHDCVGALLVRDGEVLLGLRAADRDWLPGVRDLSGGPSVAGEMAEDALRHESREELGIDPLVFRAAGVLESEAGAWRLQVFIVDSWKGGLASGSRTSTLRCAGPRRRKRGR